MLYDLSNDYQRKAFLSKSNALLEKGAVVEVTEKSLRTKSQNAYLHLLIGIVALETGNTLEYAKEVYFKRLCNRDLFVVTMTDSLAGHIELTRSSADLTKAQMSTAIDRFKRWGSENGIYLPDADDDTAIRQASVEMGRHQSYLGG